MFCQCLSKTNLRLQKIFSKICQKIIPLVLNDFFLFLVEEKLQKEGLLNESTTLSNANVGLQLCLCKPVKQPCDGFIISL